MLRFTRPVCALALLAYAALPVFGQAGLGSITGELLDPSGAHVPNAALRLVEPSTQSVRTVVSNTDGLFTFPSVTVGKYTLTIKSPGFKDRQLTNLELNAFQQLSLGQIKLEIGSGPAETVTVTTQQELIKDSGVRTETISARQVADMPLQGRNWVTLLKIIPGANATSLSAFSGREFTSTGYADFRINGKGPNQTQVNLDGGSIVDQGSDAKTTVTPSLESIQEVSVLTNNFQAEYGYRAGAVINVVTKSGTNNFHATIFDDLRNEAFNANSWQNNYQGLPRAKYRYNYIGGNLGGPIKKNRLFFFYNYENFIQNTPSPVALSRTPTELERQGDFSQTLNSDGSKPVIYNPGTQFTGTPVPLPGNVIPKNLINPLGTAIMNVFPLPNNPSDRNNNYALQYQTKQPRFSHTIKGDWNMAENTRMYVRLTDDGGTQQDRNQGTTSGNLVPALVLRPRPDRAVAGNLTHTFGPTLVMESLVSWSFDRVDWIAADPEGVTRAKYGLSGLPTTFKPANDILPGINIGTYPTFAFSRVPAYSYTNEYQFSTNFTWSKGRHIIKFGMMHVRNYKNEIDSGNDKGTYTFTPSPSPFDMNYGPANVLTGAISSFTQTRDVLHKDALYTDTHFFIQDTFKITSHLTLDFGVRLYHMPTQHQIDPSKTNDAVFLPSRWDPAKAPRIYVPDPKNPTLIIDPASPNSPLPSTLANVLRYTVVPNSGDLMNGVVALGAPGVGTPGILDPKALLFAPRLGFAWSPMGSTKTVIRGGFGMGYNRENIAQTMNAFEGGLSPTANVVQTSFATLANPTVAPITIRSYGTRDEGSRAVPTVFDYSLSVQRELPFSMVLDVAYIGNQQRHQPIQFNLNAIPIGTDFSPQYIDPRNAGYNFFGPVTASNPGALPGSNIVDNSVMRPYRGFDSLTMNENAANVHYNSLQLSLSKRFGHGLGFQGAYTLAKTMGQIDSIGLFSHNWKDYTGYELNNDRRHVVNINSTYDVPKLARRIHFDNPLGRRIFDEWRLAHLFTFFTGAPYTPGYSIQQANTTTSISLNQVFVGTPDLGPRLALNGDPGSVQNGSVLYFNPNNFGVPGVGTDGTGPRNYLFSQSSFANDISVVKTVRLTEKHAFELRATAYNAFNQPRHTSLNTSIQYKAQGKNFSDGFSVFNTPDQLAARNPNLGGVALYNVYRTGVGYQNVTDVQSMRVIEIGLKYKF
ncbi:MAG: hypothetical protein JWP63_5895 [Candidatus Solibacter sp.]|nr:hypothetical protein [Candidatus Solibacter sp.]